MKKYFFLLFIIIVSCSNTGKDEISLPYQDLNATTTSCIVVYNANGAEGNPPIDTTTYRPNDIVKVLPNTNLAMENYSFIGWSLYSNCRADIIKPGSTFVITESTMLYACFTNDTVYQVIYFAGEAQTGLPPVDTNYYITGEYACILPNSGNLQKRGYKFNGWLTMSNQMKYMPGDLVLIENQNIELIAQFIPKPLTVTYYANGATTGTVPVDNNFYEQGELVTIAHNSGNLAIINKDGVSYCFDFWGDSFGNTYLPGNSYPIEQSLQLYAQYRQYIVRDTGPAGGYVFYDKGYYSDGWRYLEAMRFDISDSGIVWEQQLQAGQYRTTGATATQIGTGRINTLTILQILGSGQYAAKLCASMIYNNYNDWYLPSKDELNLLFQYKSSIGNFTSYNYWSSSEYTQSRAWCQNFGTGAQSTQYKNNTYRVRAIRQF
ncbi:MAG: InlB B-repeat-containing protein [Spirochaetes bacterium]|nr:InlB B-repeat-containing protein [Spirochaetota bacterium]